MQNIKKSHPNTNITNHFFHRNDSITLDQLKNFIAIYELGGLSKVAEATYKTQPAISHSLSKLEEKMNAQLVIRDRGKGVTFTEEGHHFYRKIAPLIDQLLIKIDEIDSRNTITIGVPDDLNMTAQLELYNKISLVTNNRLRFICGFSSDIRDMVENGRISFGIIKKANKKGNLRYAWAYHQKISFDDFDKIPLVAGYSGCIIRDLTEKILNHIGKDYYFTYLSSRIFHRTEAVKAGFGLGVFSYPRIKEIPGLVILEEKDNFPDLMRFDYHLLGECDTAQKHKILPILKEAIKTLNIRHADFFI